jgi:hypothetical protein
VAHAISKQNVNVNVAFAIGFDDFMRENSLRGAHSARRARQPSLSALEIDAQLRLKPSRMAAQLFSRGAGSARKLRGVHQHHTKEKTP